MLEQIMAQVENLSLEDRVLLIQQISETVLVSLRGPRLQGPGLVYGAARGSRMSTEEDFGVAVDIGK